MRVLVTGHLGYIGTVLVPMLLQRGHEVTGFDSDLYRRCTFGPESAITKVPELRKDVRDAEAADLRGFDAVMHLAALSNDPLGDMNPSAHLRHQPQGLRAPRGAGARDGRAALDLLVLVQQLRRGGRRPARR